MVVRTPDNSETWGDAISYHQDLATAERKVAAEVKALWKDFHILADLVIVENIMEKRLPRTRKGLRLQKRHWPLVPIVRHLTEAQP